MHNVKYQLWQIVAPNYETVGWEWTSCEGWEI